MTIDYTDVKASLIAEWRSLGGTIEARTGVNLHLIKRLLAAIDSNRENER